MIIKDMVMDEQAGTGSDKREHPFFIVDNVVLELGLKAVELALYVAILRYVNHKTNIAFPSAETLAKAAGMKRATVLRTIPKLEEKGLIKVIRSSGRANHYLVLDPREAQTSDSKLLVSNSEVRTSDSKSPVPEDEPVTLSDGCSDSKLLGSDSKSQVPVTLSHPNKKDSNKTNQPDDPNQTSSTNESDPSPDPPSLGGAPVDDEKRLVQVEAEKLGLTQDWREQLLSLETDQAIGLMLHARRKGRNPAGLLITMLRVEQPPPEDMLALVPLALEMETLDVKELEAERRRRDYRALQDKARQIAEARQTKEEHVKSTPEQGGEGLDERLGGGGLSWRNIWQAEMGQLALMLNKSTFAAIRKTELVEVAGDVLKLRAPSALAQQQLERLRETIEQQLERMTGIPVKIQVNGVTHGTATHGTDPDADGNATPDRPLPADAPLRTDDAGCDGERAGHQLDERGELHDEQATPGGVGALVARPTGANAVAECVPHAGRGAGG